MLRTNSMVSFTSRPAFICSFSSASSFSRFFRDSSAISSSELPVLPSPASELCSNKSATASGASKDRNLSPHATLHVTTHKKCARSSRMTKPALCDALEIPRRPRTPEQMEAKCSNSMLLLLGLPLILDEARARQQHAFPFKNQCFSLAASEWPRGASLEPMTSSYPRVKGGIRV